MLVFGNTCINTGITAIGMIIWNALTSHKLTDKPIILSEYNSGDYVLGMNYFFFAYFFLFQPSEFNLVAMFMWISYKSAAGTGTSTGASISASAKENEDKEKQKPKKSSDP